MNGIQQINLLKSILFSFIFIYAIFIVTNSIASIFLVDAKIIFIVPILQIISFVIIPIQIMKNNEWNIKYNLKLLSSFKINHFFAGIASIIGYLIFSVGFSSLLNIVLPENLSDLIRKMSSEHNLIFDKFLFHSNIYIVLITSLMLVFVAPFTEEILFRGFLLTPLENALNKRKAIALSAALFALVHMNPAIFVHLFILGIILGYFAAYTKNIFVPIFIHLLNNLFAFIEMQMAYKNNELLTNFELSASGSFLFFIFGIGIIIYSIYYITSSIDLNKEN